MGEVGEILEAIQAEIDAGFEWRIGIPLFAARRAEQLKASAVADEDMYRYGYGKSLDAYLDGKRLVDEIIRKYRNKQEHKEREGKTGGMAMKKAEIFTNEMHEMKETVLCELTPKEDCTVEELAWALADDRTYQDYRQTLMLLGTCGEQIGIRYGEVGEIQDAYRDQVVKSAMAVVQPGERAVFYTFALK